MYESWASSRSARAVMKGNRSADTTPELAVRKLLHGQGLRYRVDYRPSSEIRRRADIVFTRRKVAVFIDGCFWHGCPQHYKLPRTNSDYWDAKIAGNVARDRDTDRRLRDVGWTVLRFWEHIDPSAAASAISSTVDAQS